MQFDEDTEVVVHAPTRKSVSLTITWCNMPNYGPGFYLVGKVPWGPFASEEEAKQFARDSLVHTHLELRQ